MLHLTLLRHAKSSWDDPALSDHERQLTERGTKAAARMGRFMVEHNLNPDLILCSNAIRAHATLALIRPTLTNPTPQTIIAEDLYLASPTDIADVISCNAGTASHVLVVGHNPGLHALALMLASKGKAHDLKQLAMKYPTATLANFALDIRSWADLPTASGELQLFATPRRLKT